MILGVAYGLATGTITATITPYFTVVRDGDEIVLAAFMSLPGKLGVARSRSVDAIAALSRDIHEKGPQAETVGGPEPTAGDVASALARLLGGKAERQMGQRLHELTSVVDGGNAPGAMRLARDGDAELLTAWTADFYGAVGDGGSPVQRVRELMSQQQLYVWDHDGPVSMAAWSGKTPNGVRVSYVYTPPASRGRGYATRCVARLSQLLLDRGNRYCCLYTDLANPTSNAIYARIGYRPVCDAGMYRITWQVTVA